jgi:hypothetical protein
MPTPTTSPWATVAGSNASSVSSTIDAVPYFAGVADASTYIQRGVITAVPKERSLGLTRWTRIEHLKRIRRFLRVDVVASKTLRTSALGGYCCQSHCRGATAALPSLRAT